MSTIGVQELRITSTGFSNAFRLERGEHIVFFESDGWGSATLQMSKDGVRFGDVEENGSVFTITANRQRRLPGGDHWYRLNVTTAPNHIFVKSSALVS